MVVADTDKWKRVNMELEAWHYYTIRAYHNMIFGKTFNESHLMGKGTQHQQEDFYEISSTGMATEWSPSEAQDTFYYKLKKDDKQYIMPKRFLEKMPFVVKRSMPVRLKKSDTVVWEYIQSVTSLHIPEKKLTNYREFIDCWNPMEHSNPKAFTLLKIITFAHTQGLKMAICAETACGKNSHMTLLKSFIGRTAPKVKAPSKAAFWQILSYNDRINIDEITSWTKTDAGMIEDMLVDIADDSPDTDKHSLGINGKIASTDLMKKGLTFTFNPISRRNPNTFESRFDNADKILDRYPIILLTGKVTSSVPKPSPARAEALVGTNFNTLKMWSANAQYFTNNIDKEIHEYNQDKNPFANNARHLSNTRSLIDHIDAYCESQQEFDEWMEFLAKAQHSYRENQEVLVEDEDI